MKPTSILPVLVLVPLFAGCSQPIEEEQPLARVLLIPSWGAHEVPWGGRWHHVITQLMPPNTEPHPLAEDWDVVRFGFTREKMRSHLANEACQSMALPGEQYYWLAIWNRTTLVHYDEQRINWTRADHPVTTDFGLVDWIEARLPTGPDQAPYLLFPGSTCAGDGQLEHKAEQCFGFDGHGRLYRGGCSGGLPPQVLEPDGVTPRTISTAGVRNVSLDVRVPAGSLVGETTFPMFGDAFFVMGGNIGLWADHVAGQRYGIMYTYEPVDRCEGAASWVWRYSSSPMDRDAYARHGLTGAPGPYRVRVELTAPFPTETLWRMVPHQLFTFQPALRELGFEYPLGYSEEVVCPAGTR